MSMVHKRKTYTTPRKRNKKGVYLDLSEDEQFLKEAYADYCQWLKDGHPCRFWSYVDFDKNLSIGWETMKKNIHKPNSPLDPLLMKDAIRQRFLYWSNEGRKLLKGEYKGGSPKTWENFMRNTFRDAGWDTSDPSAGENFKSDLEQFIHFQAQKLVESEE